MKKIALLAAAALMLACHKKGGEQVSAKRDSAYIRMPDSVYVSVNQDLLDRFAESSGDTLRFTPDRKFPSEKLLTDHDRQLLPFTQYIKDVYAAEKFKINRKYTGLVTSGNAGKIVDLGIYSHLTESIKSSLRVAAETSEPGFFGKTESWIVRDSGRIRGVMHVVSEVKPVDANDPSNAYTFHDYYKISYTKGKLDTTKIAAAKLGSLRGLMRKK